ncbi:hypothetical protein CEP53_005474 [Fusarium sp. AF-6]|nr:hypothetical protein CEP53_005474 [Fusarium sp. AF-6]
MTILRNIDLENAITPPRPNDAEPTRKPVTMMIKESPEMGHTTRVASQRLKNRVLVLIRHVTHQGLVRGKTFVGTFNVM